MSKQYWDHQVCIIDEVSSLLNRGFHCYLEYNIMEDSSNRTKGIFVDIYAVRGNEEIIIEVGTCYHLLQDYKNVKPNAKVIFVDQWKNYGLNGYVMMMMAREWNRIVYGWLDFPELRESRLRDLESKIWDLDRRVPPWI
ncbi:hypothetical protein MUP77_16140 [Candidatus Bathyarchaeota archaeon]|nr:hypothetical protein [Candidatus Bathyarchaeota archaeon]